MPDSRSKKKINYSGGILKHAEKGINIFFFAKNAHDGNLNFVFDWRKLRLHTFSELETLCR